MNISFKGFENTGIGLEINPKEKIVKKAGAEIVVPPYKHLTLNAKLNNIGEKDLDNFRRILEKFPNASEKDSVNFSYDEYYSNFEKKTKKEFWLNDKPLILNDHNLEVFSKLAKLFTRLSKVKDNELKQDKNYIGSLDCRYNFSYFNRYPDSQEFEYYAKGFHNPSEIRENAAFMSDEFQKMMTDYFN